MNHKILCKYERQIASATKSGSLSDELKNHLADCADCRETQKIALFFQKNLAAEKLPKKLPNAGFIWWKSQLQKKRTAANRAVKPIFIVQTAAFVIVSLIIISLLIVFSPIEFIGSSFSRLFDSLTLIIVPILVGVGSLATISVGSALALRRLYSQE